MGNFRITVVAAMVLLLTGFHACGSDADAPAAACASVACDLHALSSTWADTRVPIVAKWDERKRSTARADAAECACAEWVELRDFRSSPLTLRDRVWPLTTDDSVVMGSAEQASRRRGEMRGRKRAETDLTSGSKTERTATYRRFFESDYTDIDDAGAGTTDVAAIISLPVAARLSYVETLMDTRTEEFRGMLSDVIRENRLLQTDVDYLTQAQLRIVTEQMAMMNAIVAAEKERQLLNVRRHRLAANVAHLTHAVHPLVVTHDLRTKGEQNPLFCALYAQLEACYMADMVASGGVPVKYDELDLAKDAVSGLFSVIPIPGSGVVGAVLCAHYQKHYLKVQKDKRRLRSLNLQSLDSAKDIFVRIATQLSSIYADVAHYLDPPGVDAFGRMLARHIMSALGQNVIVSEYLLRMLAKTQHPPESAPAAASSASAAATCSDALVPYGVAPPDSASEVLLCKKCAPSVEEAEAEALVPCEHTISTQRQAIMLRYCVQYACHVEWPEVLFSVKGTRGKISARDIFGNMGLQTSAGKFIPFAMGSGFVPAHLHTSPLGNADRRWARVAKHLRPKRTSQVVAATQSPSGELRFARPGHANLLFRHLDVPLVNLGGGVFHDPETKKVYQKIE